MSTENVLSFTNALEELNKISEIFKFDVWVPSLKRYFEFKPINGKQQKELLGAAMDTSLYNITFSKVFYSIVKENIVSDDNSIVDSFNLIDKASIALHLRSKISDKITVSFDKIKEEFEIQPLINGILNYKTPDPASFDCVNAGFSLNVEIKLPTIKNEYDFDTEFKHNKKTEEIKTTEDIQLVVTNAFIGETSKYINKITINSKEILFDSLSYEDKFKLIEKLPSSLIQKIVEQIADWKTNLEKVLTVTSKTSNNTQVINVDSVLFLS